MANFTRANTLQLPNTHLIWYLYFCWPVQKIANVVKTVICLASNIKLILFKLSYILHLACLTFCGKPALQSNAKMHHKRIRLPSVQSIFSGLKPGETAAPACRRLHRRADLKNNQMLQNSGKCCHVKGTERASSEYNVRSASSSWNDEKCGGWTLGRMSATSGGGESGACLSQSEETHAPGCAIKHFRGTCSSSCGMRPRGLFEYRRIVYFNMAGKFVRPRIRNLNNLRIS